MKAEEAKLPGRRNLPEAVPKERSGGNGIWVESSGNYSDRNERIAPAARRSTETPSGIATRCWRRDTGMEIMPLRLAVREDR